jgi:co-chaperonin GroES (HSP10)
MTPISDRILVEPIAKEDNKTDSGIILSNKPKNENQYKVILIGPKVKYTKVGDVVQKMRYVPGVPIEYNGKICLLLREGSELDFNV